MARGGWNLDIETRCMQEVVDAGEVRILQQQKRKKWWRGQWGKSTYEAKWMQEIERHLGGRESSILKQDERKKLLRDMPPPTFRPPSQVSLMQRMPPMPSFSLTTRSLFQQTFSSPGKDNFDNSLQTLNCISSDLRCLGLSRNQVHSGIEALETRQKLTNG